MKCTQEELDALDKKAEHPELTVLCPRCGKELQYKEYSTAWEVRCPTPACIRNVWRGI